jgi:BirA family transcriptional regulator, biotin operon repressor / biotin---[acetyl-CoA-carboxylase] ligase
VKSPVGSAVNATVNAVASSAGSAALGVAPRPVASAPFNAAAEAIWQAVAPQLPTFSVEVLPEIDSTNTELMRRARAGQTEPTLLVALRQTAGRGRLGRTWHSEPLATTLAKPNTLALTPCAATLAAPPASTALTFSLGIALHRPDWSGLSLAVGVAVVQALRGMLAVHTPPAVTTDLGLKWPNDLWWRGQKLAGILIETSGQTLPRYAVIGIGVNIAAAPPVPTPPVPTPQSTTSPSSAADTVATPVPPVGLQALWPDAHAAVALQHIAPALIAAIHRFDRDGFASFQAAFESVDLLRDQSITLSGQTGISNEVANDAKLIARGVDATGALRVQTASSGVLGPIRTITSGEVSVRPAHNA